MNVTLRASTGAEIEVWREGDVFHARPIGKVGEAQVCLAVDLFEVVAEHAGLDLEDGAQAAEAMKLADEAQGRLKRRPLLLPPRQSAGPEATSNTAWNAPVR